MGSLSITLAVCGCLFAAVFAGRGLQRLLPEHHLNAESREAVKVAVGMVVTMTALLLGLLVASAKGTYDAIQHEVTQLSAKTAYLDRVLAAYGPEAEEARGKFRSAVGEATEKIWAGQVEAGEALGPDPARGYDVLDSLERLEPRNETQKALKEQGTRLAIELGELRWMLQAQAGPTVSRTMLVMVVVWLVVIFVSFSVLAPRNGTVLLASLVSAMSVAAALFLILELERPFSGMIRINRMTLIERSAGAGGGGGGGAKAEMRMAGQ